MARVGSGPSQWNAREWLGAGSAAPLATLRIQPFLSSPGGRFLCVPTLESDWAGLYRSGVGIHSRIEDQDGRTPSSKIGTLCPAFRRHR